jgi:GTP pyrophosphokinase
MQDSSDMAVPVPQKSPSNGLPDDESEAATALVTTVPDWNLLEPQFRQFLPQADLSLIRRAYEFAARAHAGRWRRSGEPYITHPLAVAEILAKLQLDQETVAAALLHDVLEDTEVTLEELRVVFGERVARLVDGVTKLGQIRWASESEPTEREKARQAESLRKMLLAMAEDVRVVLIKLADRLHNMRTLEHLARSKQARIARETMDIYAPLANRLGIGQFKAELEDLALKYLEPQTYESIEQALHRRGHRREQYLQQIVVLVKRALEEAGISAEVTGREKHITSIVRKMRQKNRSFDEIYDVLGIRVIVDEKKDCYGALGVIHSMWHPIPGEFDDYIATPKDNLYQSIHTAVIGPQGIPLEVQIRTHEMHQLAEYGIAAHWRYKEGARPDPTVEAKIAWFRQLLEWRDEIVDAQEFVESIKTDIFPEMIYVFTPKGDIIELPAGATPVDFAYRIHTEVGHQCVGAKVNGQIVSLNYKLQSGQVVQIMTSKARVGPSRDWLIPSNGYVTTASAREKIRQWFRRQQREENIAQGRHLLEQELRRLGVDLRPEDVLKLFPRYQKLEDFLAAIGYGAVNLQQVAARIAEHEDRRALSGPVSSPSPAPSLRVTGIGDLYTRLASCCKPVFGDTIVGYVTRGRGVTVHRADCHNILHASEPERIIQVAWGETPQRYPVTIRIEGWDRVGLLRDVTTLVADEGVNALSVMTNVHSDRTVTILMTLEVANVQQLSRVLQKIESVRDVYDVRRETAATPQPGLANGP